MPPGIVGEQLRPALDLPATERLEVLVIHQEDAARRAPVRAAEGGDVDAAGAAMDRVGPCVAGLLGHLLRLDHLDDVRPARVGLGVEDVDSRGAQARDNEVTTFHVWVRRVRAQA
jgi:hypothetical protein